MPKLKNNPIGSADLIEFLHTSSDFAFELHCLERLLQIGFSCEHGGSYVDRVTNKDRQFDIRAQKESGPLHVRCAVECKSLSESFPLLIMCVPRAQNESFHELVLSYHPDMVEQVEQSGSGLYARAFAEKCKSIRVDSPISAYSIGAAVGKSVAQVGKAYDNSIVANDAEVFEKWSQALASASDLADQAAEIGEKRNTICISLLLPILVVPDGMLWSVDYNQNGGRTGNPSKVNRCSFFIGRDYLAGDKIQGTRLIISHLEFVTLSGLEALTRNILDQGNSWFPPLDTLMSTIDTTDDRPS